MAETVLQALGLLFNNMSASLLLLALLIGVLLAARTKGTHKRQAVTEAFLRPMFFFALGCSSLWAALGHATHPAQVAQFIGWQPSPFQWEVAMANLGLGLTGVCSWRASRGFRWATTVVAMAFLWGAAIGHLRQIIWADDFAPGNAGSMLYTDILIPLILLLFMLWQGGRKDDMLS